MKKTLLFAVAALAAACASAQDAYKVLAPLSDVEDGTIAYLVNYDNGEKVDSSVVSDHTATFKGEIDEPILVRVIANDKRQGSMILEQGTIAFSPKKRCGVGSMLNDKLNLYSDSIAVLEEQLGAAQNEADYNALNQKMLDYRMDVFAENGDNPIGLVIALDLFYTIDNDSFADFVAKNLDLKQSKRISDMLGTIAKIKATSPGNKMLDFAVDYNGATSRFSDYVGKGKYVLVDFWASWCGPCMREIKNLKEIYNEYAGNDNFEILGVAVWDKPEDSEAAIKRLGIPWHCIINAQTIPTDLYGIMGIPSIMLFAPDGTILLRDVYGNMLQEKLRELVK